MQLCTLHLVLWPFYLRCLTKTSSLQSAETSFMIHALSASARPNKPGLSERVPPEDGFSSMTPLTSISCWIYVRRVNSLQGRDSHLPFLATTSASIMGHPSSRSIEDTVLFPEAMPPVSPTRYIFKQTNTKMHEGKVSKVVTLAMHWYGPVYSCGPIRE